MKTNVKKGASLTDAEANFVQKYSLYILLLLIAVIELIVFSDFIFFDKLYLFKGLASDSVNDTYPNYILISDYLRSEGIPKWSFRQGMGQNIFPFSFPDPLVSLLYLLKREHLAYGIAYMELIKIFLAGIFFYLFLKKRSLSAYVCIIGGLFYAFSSFIIIGSCWNIFSTEAVYLALLLLAFEKLHQNNKWYLLPLTIALITILQPFDLWLFGVFLLSYIIVRHFEKHETSLKEFFTLLLKTGLLMCLGVGIGSFFVFNEVRIMLLSPRGEGAAGFYEELLSKPILGFESGIHYVTAIMRLFSSELLGPSNQFGGWYNFMEAPLFYCGLIHLLLVPQLFTFLDNRRKQVYGLWMAFILLPVIFPFLRYSVWLFTGDYYRVYSFFVAFILMFFSLQALHFIFRNKKVNRKVLLVTLILLLIALYYPYDVLQQKNILNTRLQLAIGLFLISYTVLLLFIRSNKNLKYVQVILLGMVFYELSSFSENNVNERMALTAREYRQKTGYSDYTNEAIAYLNKIDSSFYRVSKSYSSGPSINSSLNDAKIQRFRGTGSYHSFNQLYYVRFLAGMNLINENDEEQTRWIIGLRNRPFLHSHVSIKYFLRKRKGRFFQMNYDSLTTFGDVKIFRNKYALPLGFTYDRYISRKNFDLLAPPQKGIILYNAFILNDSIYRDYADELPVYDMKDLSETYSHKKFVEDINSLRKDTLSISKWSNNRITGSITLKEKKMLFFSIPYSEGWSALVNGKKQRPIRVNMGFTGLLLDKGEHTVELLYTPPLFYTGAFVSVASILLYIFLLYRNVDGFRVSGFQSLKLLLMR